MQQITEQQHLEGIDDVLCECFEAHFAQRYYYECLSNESYFVAKLYDFEGFDYPNASYVFDSEQFRKDEPHIKATYFRYETIAEARAHLDTLMTEALKIHLA